VLRKILEPKRNGVRGDWRIVHYEELHDLYVSLNVILLKKIKYNYIGWTCVLMCDNSMLR
jgi:hypothetical protein